MSDPWWKKLARDLLRHYLCSFPLRDGKARVYALLQGTLLPPERLARLTIDGCFTLKLDLQDPNQRKIFYYGQYDERYETALVRRVLQPGQVFWDIGANIGYFTLVAAAAVQNHGQVVAFEPGEAAWRRLHDNIALNPFNNILTYSVAVTDRVGQGVLYSADTGADGCATLYRSGAGQARSQTCTTVTLDHLQAEQGLAPPDFIKLDVEGAELAALRGGANLLAAAQPMLLVEMKEATLKAAGLDKGAIETFLKGFGYRPVFLHRRRWYLTDSATQARSRNILWLNPNLERHRDQAARIPVQGMRR